MRLLLLTPAVLGSLLLLGCAEGSPPPQGEQVESDEGAIINGSPDVTHTAVVAVLSPDFECTGTVLQVKGSTGYVLTAGHCCPANDLPDEVVVGPDYTTGAIHPIVAGSVLADPCYLDYAGSTDDVCLLKFQGAAGVPTIAPMTPQTDALVNGTPITYVGYGLTAAPPNGNNSLRRSVAKTVSKVDPYFVEYANAAQSGTCEGDSGGPGIVVVNGQELVASVTSFGDQSCNQLGSSIRTSAVYAGFIAPYLADQVPSPTCPAATDCNACSAGATQNGSCVNATNACFQDADCAALVQCYQGCTSTSCINACNTQHVDGLTQYVAIERCVCVDACATACGNTTTCTGPKCGLKVTDTTCTTCVETTCCAEAWECQADTACRKCFGASPPAACAANAKAAAFYACAKDQCSCAVPDPANGSTTAASSSAATTGGGETTTSGAGGASTTSTAASVTSTVGVGGGAASTTGAGGSDGSSSGDGAQVGGCACSGTGSGGRTPPAPFAALALGVAGMVARRRRAR
jgi:MYXO-CTERM domain-containing protein